MRHLRGPEAGRYLTLGAAVIAAASVLLIPDAKLLLAQEGDYEPVSEPTTQVNEAERLSNLPGLTPPERAMGFTVGTLCPQMAAIGSSNLNVAQQDLLTQCTAILTAPDNEAASGIAALTPEQATAPRRMDSQVVRTQVTSLSARLSALRAGAAGQGGLSISGLGLQNQPLVGGAASGDGYEFERLAFFINGNLDWGNKDRSTNEDGFDYNLWGLTAGADYVFTEGLVLGLALGYNGSNVDIDANGGKLDINNWTLSAYGTWYALDNFYLEGSLGYGWGSYDQTRNISYGLLGGTRSAKADFDGNQFNFMFGGGYDITFGSNIVDVYARLQYLSAELDAYTERGANGLDLRIRSQDSDSTRSILGASFQRSISTKHAVLVPQVWAEWAHEFDPGDQNVTGSFVNDPNQIPFILATDKFDTDFFRLGVGLGAQFAKGYTAFVSYEATLGLRDYSEQSINAGVRMAF
jgi:outer membrane lipase/esterase